MTTAVGSDLNPFRISWNRHSRAQWDTMLEACYRPGLTQSAAYALALHDVRGMKADLGVIRFHDKPVGLMVAHGKPAFGAP
jgi:hypothetical protein